MRWILIMGAISWLGLGIALGKYMGYMSKQYPKGDPYLTERQDRR